MRYCSLVLAASLLLGAGLIRQSQGGIVAYDNLQNGYKNVGLAVNVDVDQWGQLRTIWSATDFVPSESGKLDEIATAMVLVQGDNAVTLLLCADDAGKPGSVLWQQTYENRLGDTLGDVFQTSGIANAPELAAGTRYWVEAQAPLDDRMIIFWYVNASGDLGSYALLDSHNNGPIVTDDVDRLGLRVGVVPLPLSVWMALPLLAFVGIAGLRRRLNP